jgi:hypothetical protein
MAPAAARPRRITRSFRQPDDTLAPGRRDQPRRISTRNLTGSPVAEQLVHRGLREVTPGGRTVGHRIARAAGRILVCPAGVGPPATVSAATLERVFPATVCLLDEDGVCGAIGSADAAPA